MYKTRIKKWGIDKNQKATEVAQMLFLKQQREKMGKPRTEFVVRGRKVDWAKIEQYLKREPVLMRKLEATDGELHMVVGRSSGIICRTPSPDPACELSVPPAPVAEGYRMGEEIGRLLRDYYLGAMDGVWVRVAPKSWTSPRGAQGLKLLQRWISGVTRSQQLIEARGRPEDFRLLSDAMDLTPQLLRDQDPVLVSMLVANTLCIGPKTGCDIAGLISRNVRDLLHLIHGPAHPLTRVFDRIVASFWTDEHYTALYITSQCLAGSFATVLEPYAEAFFRRFLEFLEQQPHDADCEPAGGDMHMQDFIDALDVKSDFAVNLRFATADLAFRAQRLMKVSQRLRRQDYLPSPSATGSSGLDTDDCSMTPCSIRVSDLTTPRRTEAPSG